MIAPFAVPGGAVGLLGAVAWMVFTGRLIPASTVDKMLAVKQEEIAALNRGYDAEKARNELLTIQVGELMELSRTATAALNALPRAKDAAT